MSTNGVVAVGREAVAPSIPVAPSPAVASVPAAAEAVVQDAAASGVTTDAVRVSLSLRRTPEGASAANSSAAPTEEGVDAGEAAKELDERLVESSQKTVVRFGPTGTGEAESAELSFKVVNPSTGETVREYPNPDGAAERGGVVNDVA